MASSKNTVIPIFYQLSVASYATLQALVSGHGGITYAIIGPDRNIYLSHSLHNCIKMSTEDPLKKRKELFDKESEEFLRKIKVESQLGEELIKLSNVDSEKVEALLKNYQKQIDAVIKEDAPPFPKLEE
jgi:hypothetical protein